MGCGRVEARGGARLQGPPPLDATLGTGPGGGKTVKSNQNVAPWGAGEAERVDGPSLACGRDEAGCQRGGVRAG